MYTTTTAAAKALVDYRREEIRRDLEQHRVASRLRRWNRLHRFDA